MRFAGTGRRAIGCCCAFTSKVSVFPAENNFEIQRQLLRLVQGRYLENLWVLAATSQHHLQRSSTKQAVTARLQANEPSPPQNAILITSKALTPQCTLSHKLKP